MDYSFYKNFTIFLQSLIASPGYRGRIKAINFNKSGKPIEVLGYKPKLINSITSQNSFKLKGFTDVDEFVVYHDFSDLSDIEDFKEIIEKGFIYYSLKHFERLTYIDDITGYFNQRALKRDIQELIKSNTQFQVFFMDIDNFKSVNDQHGHFAGSLILKDLATVISEVSSNFGNLYRYGGDEFVVIVPDLSAGKAMQLGQNIRRQVLEKKFVANEKTLNFSISIGVSEYPTQAKTLEEIISIADHMMYASKKSGKNAVHQAKSL